MKDMTVQLSLNFLLQYLYQIYINFWENKFSAYFFSHISYKRLLELAHFKADNDYLSQI